jgi:hypothetical protein
MTDAPLRRIAGDFEFRAATRGHKLEIVSAHFLDLDTGEDWYLTEGEFGPKPPFPTDESAVCIFFAADADLACFAALDWELPRNVICFRGEFRRMTASIEEPEL